MLEKPPDITLGSLVPTFFVAHSVNMDVIADDAAGTEEFPTSEMSKSISLLFC